jgi:hypothetical protein
VQADTLSSLLDRRFLQSRPRVRIELDAPELTADEHDRWQKLLERSYNACGCELGAAALVAAFPLLAVLFATGALGLSLFTPLGLVVFVAAPIAAAILGKLVGVLRARRRLKRAIGDLSGILARRRV